LLTFEDGSFATLTYSGYAHFDSDDLLGWIGELGGKKDPAAYGAARRALKGVSTPSEETALKNRRAYGAGDSDPAAIKTGPLPAAHNHFGVVVASCERGDLRPLPDRIAIYGSDGQREEMLPRPAVPRAEVIDELYGAVFRGEKPLHGGEWGCATLEVCLAILRSAREGREVTLERQVAV
jgi:phthalate 4,5-cis-dihydrodiol dehydrogenase